MQYICLVLCALWIPAPPIRNVADPTIVGDIESHLPAGHPYGDPDLITTVHEGTHGINSLLRNQYGMPCFYLLNNKAARIKEPLTTLNQVALRVPKSLRGDVYHLYLVQMQRYWNRQPSYILDEYVAYTNGAEARERLGIKMRTETVDYMLEFSVYATVLAVEQNSPELQELLKYQLDRVLRIYQRAGYISPYMIRLRGANDDEATRFKTFAAAYYGRGGFSSTGRIQSWPLLDCDRVQASRVHAKGFPQTQYNKRYRREFRGNCNARNRSKESWQSLGI